MVAASRTPYLLKFTYAGRGDGGAGGFGGGGGMGGGFRGRGGRGGGDRLNGPQHVIQDRMQVCYLVSYFYLVWYYVVEVDSFVHYW